MKKPVHKTSGEVSRGASRKSSRTIEVKEPAAGETVSDVPDTAAGAAAARESLAELENQFEQRIAGSNLATKRDLVEMEGRFSEKFATKQDLWETKTELKQDLFDMERRLDEKLASKVEKLASKEALSEMEKRFDQKFATKQDLAEQEKRLVENLASKEALAENKRDIVSSVRWAAGVIIVVQIPLYIRLFFG